MYKVKVYFKCHRWHYFIARDKENAMEIAGRINVEGCWITNSDGTEELFPVHMIAKIKVIPPDYKELDHEEKG